MHFVFDIDGTTSFNGLFIEPVICDAFRDLRQAGHSIVLASARPVRDMQPMLPADLKDITCVGANGAQVFKDGALTIRQFIEDAAFARIRKLIEEHELDFLADGEGAYAFRLPGFHYLVERIDVDQMDTRVNLQELSRASKVIVLNIADKNLHKDLLARISLLNVEISEHDDPTGFNIDMVAPGINKQVTLEHVVAGQPYIAFGNDTNDLEMLDGAILSVAVGDKPQIIAAANRHCAADADAVTRIISALAS